MPVRRTRREPPHRHLVGLAESRSTLIMLDLAGEPREPNATFGRQSGDAPGRYPMWGCTTRIARRPTQSGQRRFPAASSVDFRGQSICPNSGVCACSTRSTVDPNFRQARLAQMTAKLATHPGDRDPRAQMTTQEQSVKFSLMATAALRQ
jgi:hypothetical protein